MMSIQFTLNNAVANDQSSGLQTGVDSGLHADTDVSVASLTAAFHGRLGDLGLIPDAFATDVGAASQLNTVTVTPSGSGSITSLGFSGALDDNGTPVDTSDDSATSLAVYDGSNFGAGGMTGLTTVDGEEIRLFRDADSGLGDQLVFGIDENGDTVFAVYMYSTTNLDGTVTVDFHSASFEAIYHGDDTDHDDEVDLGDYLTIAASETTVIDFSGTPSGKNLFTMVLADTSNPDGFAVVVTPSTEVIQLNTSQGGGPTTLALFNQMIDPGEKMVFTFVNDPDPRYTVNPNNPNGLNQNEADLETNILFDSLSPISGGSVIISQTQGNSTHALTLRATDASGNEAKGNNFINGYLDDKTVPITSVTVFSSQGEIGTWTPVTSGNAIGGVTVSFSGGIVTVSGFKSGYTIAYDSGLHARIEVTGVSGKFDIGGIGVDLPGAGIGSVGSNVVFDDDGPTAALATTAATVTLDETDDDGDDADGIGGDLANVTVSISTLFNDTSVFGTDGAKDADVPEDGTDDDATTYSLVLTGFGGADSGLVDTATGQAIYLYEDGADIVGRVGSDGLADVGGAISFRIKLTNDPDTVQVIQLRAVEHDDMDDHDESTSPESINVGLVLVQVTVIDDDGDSSTDSAELGSRIKFEDDGPAVTAGTVNQSLVTDDSDISGGSDTAMASFAGSFTVAFGSDGAYQNNADTATYYTLGVAAEGTDSGLVDAMTDANILLRMNGSTIEGYLANDTTTIAFTISVVSDGANGGDVTLTQLRAIEHNDPNDPVEEDGNAETMASADKVTLTATAKDGDSDADSATIDIGLTFAFEDDGPSVSIIAEATAVVALDETDNDADDNDVGGILATKSITVAEYLATNSADPGEDGEKSDIWSFVDPDPVGLGTIQSGLVDTASGQDVVLSLEGKDIVGTTETDGDEVVRWTINVDTGEVTVTQLRAVVHGDETDHDEADTPATLNPNSIVVARTLTDNDEDAASEEADISAVFKFEDDGPAAAITDLGGTVTHDESAGAQNSGIPDPVVGEDNDDDDQDGALPAIFAVGAIGWARSANAVVDSTGTSFGSDGAAALNSEVWSLTVGADSDSGFNDLSGNNILLTVEGDLVVGRVDADGDGNVDNGDVLAIAISIDQSGFLSIAQYISLQHPSAAPDEQITMNDAALLAVLTVMDGDGDTHEVTEPIGDKVIIEDDAPTAAQLTTEVLEEDDLDGSSGNLSSGNDNDSTDGAGDGTGTKHTSTSTIDPGLNVFEGADQPISYNFKDLDQATLDELLPALVSKGDAVTYTLSLNQTTNLAGDTDVLTASADGRMIFTVELIDLGLAGATVVFTLNDQLDHVFEPDTPAEGQLLQLLGGGSIETLDFTGLFDLKDADGDPASLPAGFNSYKIIDDSPEIAGPAADPGVVDFLTGQFVSRGLNGSVGSDENDANNETGGGDKTYTFTFATDASETITSTSIAGLTALVSADGTMIQYYVDGYGDSDADGVIQAEELFFDVVLGDQGGSGDYTFNVYQGAPQAFTEFDFTDLPSGQNLHGTIAANKLDLSEGGILLFPEGTLLNPSTGEFTNASPTTNTSKGGGPVTIGNTNQMFNPGEGHYFVYVDSPAQASVAGITGGLTQNTADDADTVGFNGTIEVTRAQVEIVQVQGNVLASMTIEAFDLANGTLGAVGTGGTTNPRDFLTTPEATATAVNIIQATVFAADGETILEQWRDEGAIDGNYVQIVGAGNNINITFNEVSTGVYTATVSGVNDNYTVQWTTQTPHDMTLVHAEGGKYDIGGFNLLQTNETPDQLFDFTLDITDFDGDTASSGFQVVVDGTGQYDDDMFDLTPGV